MRNSLWEKKRRNRCYSKAEVLLANNHPGERTLEYGWALEEGRKRTSAMRQAYTQIRLRHPEEFRRLYEEALSSREVP